MKAIIENGIVKLTLSKRNIMTLLHKLEMEGSKRMLIRYGDGHEPTFVVTVEPDEVHYVDREAGKVHPQTEAFLKVN